METEDKPLYCRVLSNQRLVTPSDSPVSLSNGLPVACSMPAQGWKVVSVREEVFNKVEKRAEKEHRSVTNMVEAILLEATEK